MGKNKEHEEISLLDMTAELLEIIAIYLRVLSSVRSEKTRHA